MNSELPRRVFGVETEYGLSCVSTQAGLKAPLDADEAARLLFSDTVQRVQSTSEYLSNGGRVYLDVGSHPEYATAECAQLPDLLAQDRAGVQILAQMAQSANEKLLAQGVPGRLHLFKNNLDSQGNSFGCHENYLLHRSGQYRALVDSLVVYFVTRQILTGAGAILEIGSEKQFCLSQRAYKIYDGVSAATTRTRPIVNTRDEPHADSAKYRRMHVIVGDSNVLESPLLLKVGATVLLLGALEAGVTISDLELADPMRAIREITVDLSGKSLVELKSGKCVTALELQREIFTRVQMFVQGRDLDSSYPQVMQLWDTSLSALEAGRWEDLVGVLDWPTKLSLLERIREKKGISWADPAIARIDLAYHDITEHGLHLDERGYAERLTTPEQIAQARRQPPADTRAALRGDMITLAAQHHRDLGVDWMHIRLHGSSIPTLLLPDPFATVTPEADQMRSAISNDPAAGEL